MRCGVSVHDWPVSIIRLPPGILKKVAPESSLIELRLHSRISGYLVYIRQCLSTSWFSPSWEDASFKLESLWNWGCNHCTYSPLLLQNALGALRWPVGGIRVFPAPAQNQPFSLIGCRCSASHPLPLKLHLRPEVQIELTLSENVNDNWINGLVMWS